MSKTLDTTVFSVIPKTFKHKKRQLKNCLSGSSCRTRTYDLFHHNALHYFLCFRKSRNASVWDNFFSLLRPLDALKKIAVKSLGASTSARVTGGCWFAVQQLDKKMQIALLSAFFGSISKHVCEKYVSRLEFNITRFINYTIRYDTIWYAFYQDLNFQFIL